MTQQRINVFKLAPEVYQAVMAFQKAAAQGLDPAFSHLVVLRASQINHCAYCIDMHTKDARAAGVSEEKIALTAAFEEAPNFFDEKERAALALCESMTLLADSHVPDDVYERAAKHYDDKELAQLISLITAINVWNRFQVTTRAEPGHYRARQQG